MIDIDIVSISRIEKLLEKFPEKGLDRFLCESEKLLANKPETIAGFWAAKEAFSKAVGTGIGKELSFLDIVIKKTKKGKPYIFLSDQLKENFSLTQIELSISHDGGFAIAAVITYQK